MLLAWLWINDTGVQIDSDWFDGDDMNLDIIFF